MARLRDAFGIGTDMQIPINNVSVGPSTTVTADIDVSGYGRLLVAAWMFGTVTPGDLTYSVKPYDADGVTVFNQDLPNSGAQNTAAVGADILGSKSYDVRGLKLVRISVFNANIAAKNATIRTYAGTP